MSQVKYQLLEYKLLKEEAKSYTDVYFRDLQVLITIIAIFATLLVSSIGAVILGNFWSYAIGQGLVYIFLLIQLSRIVYILILRKHLVELEYSLSYSNNEDKLIWESSIVPNQIEHPKSLNFQIQLTILFIYFALFIFLSTYSLKCEFLNQIQNKCIYCLCIVFEYISLAYFIVRVILVKFRNAKVSSNLLI